MRTKKVVAALSLAGAISLGSMPLQAAPLTSLSAAVKPAAQASDTIQVRWGGWHGGWHGGGWGFGIGALAAGALIGAAIASPYYDAGYPYYDAGYPYYGSPYYSYSYGYPSYSWGVSTTYYPAYSYRYYRPFRRYAYGYRYYRPHRHFWHRGYAMYGVHRYRHHWR